MFSAVGRYFERLCGEFGRQWNLFWFSPSDPYTLGVMRVLCGLVALYTVVTYGLDLDRFFGPAGMLSVRTADTLAGVENYRFSYLDYLDGDTLWIAHWIGVGILTLYVLGVFTRVTAVLALLVFVSYLNRAPVITAQFESVLPAMMFYLCLGPCGADFSIDACLRDRKTGGRPLVDALTGRPMSPKRWSATVVLRLIQVHVAMVYMMMALGKLQWYVWWEGTAVWWLSLNTEAAVFDFRNVAVHPYLTNIWTHAIVLYECLFPVFIWRPLFRPLLLGAGLVLWILTGLLTGLITFAAVMLIGNLAFVPGEHLRTLLAGRKPAAPAAVSA